MKNFAEEITYWYFRLNGFFLLTNYVSHKSDTDTTSHADNDLIGIRTKNVKEIIGLLDPEEDICKELKKIMPEIGIKMIGLICEIKGGETKTVAINENKLESCIKRLGLIDDNDLINNAVNELKTSSKFNYKDISINKIFVSTDDNKIDNWGKIEIKTMIGFIKERMEKYKEKGKAWNHYDSSLIQYFLYEGR